MKLKKKLITIRVTMSLAFNMFLSPNVWEMYFDEYIVNKPYAPKKYFSQSKYI